MGKLEQITASAGSGKTYTLIRRFLTLLAASTGDSDLDLRKLCDGKPRPHAWPEILAATFTNAAASEMKERLVRELKKYALGLDEAQNFGEPTPTDRVQGQCPWRGEVREGGRSPLPAAGGIPTPLFTKEEAAERIETILRRFGSLNIRTIDSLLTMLVRLSSLPLGLPPDFEPVFDDGLPGHFELFFDEEQERARGGADKEACEIRELLLGCCAAVLADATRGGFMAPADFKPTVLKLIKHIWENGRLDALPTDAALAAFETELREDLGKAAFALRSSIALENLECHKNLSTFLDKLAAWCAEKPDFADAPPDSAYLTRADLQSCLNIKSPAPSEEAEIAFELCKFAHGKIKESLARVRETKRILPYARLAAHLAAPFRDYLTEQGLLPSELTGELAREILNRELGPSEAYCRFGARLNHLLLDEFQDTSREQWRAIEPLAVECLAGGGDMVYVGDVKQAIYGWRGGDADLFHEIPQTPDIARIAGAAMYTPLPSNWRSLPQIIELNNSVFSPLGRPDIAEKVSAALLGKNCPREIIIKNAEALVKSFADAAQKLPPCEDTPGRPSEERGYVRLARLSAADEKTAEADYANAGDEGVIISYGGPPDELASGDEDGADGKLSPRLAATREELRAMLLDDILTRRPYGDVAVLTRGNADARLIARWLADWEVPTLTENSLLLSEHPLITQIIAFLRFIDNPLDDPALLEFMCGEDIFLPAAALSAGELRDWLLLSRGEGEAAKGNSPGGLLQALRGDFPLIFERWLAPFYNRAGLMSAYDLTCAMLEHFKVRERRPEDAVFLRRFLELLHGAESRKMKSLGEFLDYWENFGGVEKLPVAESLDAVRIMTVHKAKGLEFPVVIAPFNDFGIKALDDYSRESIAGGKVPLRERRDFGASYFNNLARQSREALHLVYVAWTRASREFYAILPPEEGEGNKRGLSRRGGSGVPVSRALDILLAPLNFNEHGVYATGSPGRPKTLPLQSVPQTKSDAVSSPSSLAEPPFAQPMDWLPRLKIYRNIHADLGSAARERGILIHNCLKNLRRPENGAEDLESAALRAFMHARRILEMPRIEEGMYREIMDLLIWVLSLPGAEKWFAAGRPEQEILEAGGARKIMDRLVLSKKDSTVLEYKTGYLDAAPKDLPAAEHVEQLRAYLKLMEEIRGLPAQGRIIYLDRREVYPLTLSGQASSGEGGL